MLMALALIAKLLIYIGALVAIGILSHFFLAIRPNLKGLRMALTVMLAGAFSKLLIANAQLRVVHKHYQFKKSYGIDLGLYTQCWLCRIRTYPSC